MKGDVSKRLTREQQKWAENDLEERREFIRKALRDPGGQRLLLWLLEISKVGNQPFTSNALTTAFQCGELNIGNQLLADLMETDPAGYVNMTSRRDAERADRERILSNLTSRLHGNPGYDGGTDFLTAEPGGDED